MFRNDCADQAGRCDIKGRIKNSNASRRQLLIAEVSHFAYVALFDRDL